MSNDQNVNGSANAGSPITNDVPNPNDFGGNPGAGETQKTEVKTEETQIDPKQHAELESLVGTQGTELGELRKFFSDIAPLLDKLDKNPEIVQAVIDGNITNDLAKAAMEGKVSVEDAKIVDKAHEEVKENLGKEGYKGASAEEVEKLVTEKAKEIMGDVQKELKDRDEVTAFEASVNDFISRTPDFEKFASDIDKWLDKHDVTDIAVAYYAVKGELSEKEAGKQAEIDKAEAQKNMALNAGGGTPVKTHIQGNSEAVDTLIAGKSNPNTL